TRPENFVGVELRDFLKSNPPVRLRKRAGSSSLSREGYSVSRYFRMAAGLVLLNASSQARNWCSAGESRLVWAGAGFAAKMNAIQSEAKAESQRVGFIVGSRAANVRGCAYIV